MWEWVERLMANFARPGRRQDRLARSPTRADDGAMTGVFAATVLGPAGLPLDDAMHERPEDLGSESRHDQGIDGGGVDVGGFDGGGSCGGAV